MLGLNQISLAVNRLLGPGDDAVLNLNFLSGSLDSRITFTRTTSATRYNSSGLIETVASDVPRFDYDPVTLALKGLLIEELRTNLLLNSASLSTQSVEVGASPHTLSFYGTGTVVLSGTASATVVGLGAYPSRKTHTFTPTAGTLTLTVTGTVEYAQLEAGSFATSYIPTTTIVSTRQPDIAVITGTNFSSWFNASEGTFVASYANAPSSIGGIFAANDSDNSGSNRIDFRSGQGQSIISSGGVQVAGLGTGAATTGIIAIAYKVDDFAASLNGGAVVTDSSGAVPLSVDRLLIGSADDLNYQPSGHLLYIKYYNTRKPNADLQTLTT
jgi:hypothetical protein